MKSGQADDTEDLTTDTDVKLPSVQVIADLKIGYTAIQNNISVII